MRTTISDFPINSAKVKSEGKSSSNSRRLSRQASISNSSTEVYYGNSSIAVPFRWESQPGTPKVKLSERPPLPPLTPPPSYQCSPARKSVKKHSVEMAIANSSSILHSVLPKLNLIKKSNVHSSPSLSSSSSSSSSSLSPRPSLRSVRLSPFTPKSAGGQQRKRLTFYSKRKDDEDDEHEFHVSSLCFGGAGRSSCNNIRSSSGSASLIKLFLTESA